jgi:hypothetical protein
MDLSERFRVFNRMHSLKDLYEEENEHSSNNSTTIVEVDENLIT